MRRWMVRGLVAAVVLSIVVAAIGFGYPLLTGRWYRSEASLIVFAAPRPDDFTVAAGSRGDFESEELARFARNQAALLTSEHLLRRAIQWPSVRNSEWFRGFNGDIRLAAEKLDDRLDVRVVPETSMIEVSVTLSNAAESQDVVAALIEVYLQKRQIETDNEASQLDAVQQRELERAEQETQVLQQEQADFIRRYDWVGITPFERRSAALDDRQLEIQLELAALRAHLDRLESTPGDGGDADGQTPRQRDEEEQRAKDQLSAQIDETTARLDAIEPLRSEARRALIDAGLLARRLEQIDRDLAEARERHARAVESLATLRTLYRRPDASRVARHAPPSEARRVWWDWPWTTGTGRSGDDLSSGNSAGLVGNY